MAAGHALRLLFVCFRFSIPLFRSFVGNNMDTIENDMETIYSFKGQSH